MNNFTGFAYTAEPNRYALLKWSVTCTGYSVALQQWLPTLLLEINLPEDISFNHNRAHLTISLLPSEVLNLKIYVRFLLEKPRRKVDLQEQGWQPLLNSSVACKSWGLINMGKSCYSRSCYSNLLLWCRFACGQLSLAWRISWYKHYTVNCNWWCH